MATISQRLNALDRRVLPDARNATPELWTKWMSRWPLLLGLSVLQAAFAGVLGVISHSRWMAFAYLPMVLLFAFQAGAMKTEADRLKGSQRVAGKLRPPGL